MYRKMERIIPFSPDELLNELDITYHLEYDYDQLDEHVAVPQTMWGFLQQVAALRLKKLWEEENSRAAVDLIDVRFTPIWYEGGINVYAGWLVLENDDGEDSGE